MIIDINVTAQKIKKGHRLMSKSCPIALAIKSLKYVDPEVDGETIDFRDKNGTSYSAPLTKRIASFITAFDDGEKVEPAVFRIYAHEV